MSGYQPAPRKTLDSLIRIKDRPPSQHRLELHLLSCMSPWFPKVIVDGSVRKSIGDSVLLATDSSNDDIAEILLQLLRSLVQELQFRLLDLVSPIHLLNDHFGVEEHLKPVRPQAVCGS